MKIDFDKAVDDLYNGLHYAYCDNCRFADGEREDLCECCNRKAINWGVSKETLKKLLYQTAEPEEKRGFRIIDSKAGLEVDIEKLKEDDGWDDNITFNHLMCFAVDDEGFVYLLDGFGNYAGCPSERYKLRWE